MLLVVGTYLRIVVTIIDKVYTLDLDGHLERNN